MSVRTLTVKEDILGANKAAAAANREILDSRGARMINMMSASGSGKTSLILRTLDLLKDTCRIAVIEGNIGSSIDADVISEQNVPVIRVNTGGGCHLDAPMIRGALDSLDLNKTELILIENISNLVCTADFDLGAHRKVVILSVPEGDDKPCKYPVIFSGTDLVLVNKIDVLPYFDFKLDPFRTIIGRMNPSADVFPLSAKTGEGMDRWVSWVKQTLT